MWRVADHVVKLTVPECCYQIEAELQCLTGLPGKLSVQTPRVRACGELGGWPYVVMQRIHGRPISEVWATIPHDERRRLARQLGMLCCELHSLDASTFPGGWDDFWCACTSNAAQKHGSGSAPAGLVAAIEPFLRRVGELDCSRLVPVHTELTDQHVYVEERNGTIELSGLIDFADARAAPAAYEFGALIEFIFRGEPGLLREFLVAYGVAELSLEYSECLLAWSLYHRFCHLERLLGAVGPPVPKSLEELAERLFGVLPE